MKLGEIAQQFQLECRGDAGAEILGIAGLEEAGPGFLSFLFNPGHRAELGKTRASAVVLREEDAHLWDKPLLIANNPRLAWAKIADLFDTRPLAMPFVDDTAVISDLSMLGSGVAIGAHAVVMAGAVIGDGARIGPGCQVGVSSVIGAGTRLYANVVIYHDVHIGDDCIIHANAVIGSDGFGYEMDKEKGDYVKIPQVCGVRIGDRVEVGAGTTLDRGALNHTTVGDGCKLDNQVQIGHGTRIGSHTVISGCTAVAGSVKIGSHCLIGGAVGIIDNIEIVDRVEVTAMTLVSRSILSQGRYSSGTGLMPGFEWKRSIVGFRKLNEILKRLRRLETKG